MIALSDTRPGPLSLHLYLPERSSHSRVRSAAQKPRALDCSGPFPSLILHKGKGASAKAALDHLNNLDHVNKVEASL